MHMVRDAANGERFDVVLARDAADVGPETYLQVRRDERAALLGAEDAVKQAADEGMGHGANPRVQSSLRDSRGVVT
jgi:hypothetical protein